MKILHLGKYFSPFSGGVENYMRDAMVALARRGISSSALVHQHTLSLRTKVERHAAGGHEFKVVRAATWLWLLFTPISPTLPWHLWRSIKSLQPDILHLHLPNPSVFWALFLPSARRIPWVIHWHSDVITSRQGRLMRFFYRLYRPFEQAVLRRSSAIIATSPPYRDSSLPLQPWLDKCAVVPLGVDTGKFSDATVDPGDVEDEPAETGHSPLRVLAIGRLTYYKGFEYLLRAAARVPKVQVHLVGEGDQAETLTALATSLGIQDRVTLHGALSDPELARHYAACDCLCLPSIERTEAFGMVLLEAMHFGKATVIGDVEGSGMGWVVDDGVTGIKVKPADPDALVEALSRLSANQQELTSMGQAGKKKIDEQFEINRSIGGLLDIYRRTCPETKAAGPSRTS